jgi:hypothetical protein
VEVVVRGEEMLLFKVLDLDSIEEVEAEEPGGDDGFIFLNGLTSWDLTAEQRS